MGAVRGMNRSTATTTIAMTSSPTTMRSSLRAVAAVIEALRSISCSRFKPSGVSSYTQEKMSAGTKAQHERDEQQLVRRGRQAEQAEQQLADLQQDPGCDEVQRRYSKDVSTLQFRDYGHPPTPKCPCRATNTTSLRAHPPDNPSHSRRTSRALLSERRPRNAACLRRPSAVHSTNRICATSSGLTHCISRISSAVTPPPQRDDFECGRSTKGQSSTWWGFSALKTSRRR